MNFYHLFLIFNLFIGVLIYCSLMKHLLIVLLSLEFMAIMIFIFFILFLSYCSYFYSLIYLIVVACEGALGLSILVIMGRSHGGDYLNNLNFYVN